MSIIKPVWQPKKTLKISVLTTNKETLIVPSHSEYWRHQHEVHDISNALFSSSVLSIARKLLCRNLRIHNGNENCERRPYDKLAFQDVGLTSQKCLTFDLLSFISL